MSLYPWQENLNTTSEILVDFPIDEDLLTQQNETLKLTINELNAKLQSAETKLTENQSLIEQLQKVAQTTFEGLNKQNEKLKKDNEDLILNYDNQKTELDIVTKQLETAKEELEAQKENEFIYPIIVQAIMSQKAGFIGEAKIKRTITGTLRWMTQRANVIKYLRAKNLYPKVAKYLENMLFVNEAYLLKQIKNLVV